jgi:hypothetical protein
MDGAIMELDRPKADARRKAHDRIAMNAGQALGRADGAALGEGGDDGDLPVKSKNVHGANPWICGIGHELGSGKPATPMLYYGLVDAQGAKSLG